MGNVVYFAGFYSHGAGWLGAAWQDDFRIAVFHTRSAAQSFCDRVLIRDRGHLPARVGVRVALRLPDGSFLEA